ncbi:sulfite exporter TauE/SafE family protein [Nocardioides dongkuii]|uniref:sulfite exporter TauE/SafE family protein n=1 Tax=Nocardioides dongkuii TaxID=2760089 RepID=UPI0015FA46B5|nr:sulfite exporter TauE/SafE family protein [Nocardioides dongkuii]
MAVELLVAAAMVCCLAAATQAVTGFGFALMAVPPLAALTDAVQAVVIATVVGLALTSVSSVRERKHVVTAPASRMVVGGLVGMPLGLVMLTQFDESVLTLLIAGVVIALVLLLAFRVRLPAGAGAQWGSGLASGALLTSTGANGPPLVLTLQSMQLPPARSRGTLQTVFWCQELVAVAALVALGEVDAGVVALAAAGAAVCPLGWRLGDLLFVRISPSRFRGVVLACLTASATVSIVSVLA